MRVEERSAYRQGAVCAQSVSRVALESAFSSSKLLCRVLPAEFSEETTGALSATKSRALRRNTACRARCECEPPFLLPVGFRCNLSDFVRPRPLHADLLNTVAAMTDRDLPLPLPVVTRQFNR